MPTSRKAAPGKPHHRVTRIGQAAPPTSEEGAQDHHRITQIAPDERPCRARFGRVESVLVGDLVPLVVRWLADGEVVFPEDVAFGLTGPRRAQQDVEAVRVGDEYRATVEAATVGQWWVIATASGGYRGRGQHVFVVREPRG